MIAAIISGRCYAAFLDVVYTLTKLRRKTARKVTWWGNNLTLRTRIKRLARRTIGFSRSVELHEKVIGAFIEKYVFY